MGGAYKDDEATRVDASILRKNEPLEFVDLIPAAPPSEKTQRINLDEVDRRALPFKRAGDRRDESWDDDDEVATFEEIPVLAETGAMRPVKAPAMPFPDTNPKRGPQGRDLPSIPPQSNPPPNSNPPNSNPPHFSPKVAPRHLGPLDDNPLAHPWTSPEPARTPPPPRAMAPSEPVSIHPASLRPVQADNTLRIAFFAAVAILVAGVVIALVV